MSTSPYLHDMMLDLKTDEVFIDGLKWLPWIGEYYWDVAPEQRLLIIGESHYGEHEKHERTTFTREVIEERIGGEHYRTTFFRNLYLALFRKAQFDVKSFWNHVCFYNFIQRPMLLEAGVRGRPTSKDYKDGANCFFRLIEALRPTTCLFVGVEAAKYLATASLTSSYKLIEIIADGKVGRTSPRRGKLKASDGGVVDLIFIRHSSQHFSWERWNDYLANQISSQLMWLQTKI